ncbi:pyridine nucleotide-disulfide oxidoreductase-domain-containing protein [Diplogelasinospora grovesii]|uniref:Pyridine nucleotide-disulfide oxidoreductase-domain-containing protein n=1 Tax=Diplogelasinospora grovesii TaxID=303347 RepID=A0AAN6S762_9PEZI|nr:pyridine nucleotide-disulfide oxidoreductase-domain-containing protein [Diplogelasinospora grovesii]
MAPNASLTCLHTAKLSPVRYGAPCLSLTSARRLYIASSNVPEKRERVVILGSGWAGYAFARTLDPKKFERIVISPRSYFVFTPLLASTAVGTLEFRAVLEPIRRLRGGVRFHQGWADDVDFSRKTVSVEANVFDDLASRTIVLPPSPPGKAVRPHGAPVKGEIFEVPYDKLVVAVGAYSQTFGIEGVRQHAHFLRDIGDARKIRSRVLSLFEQCTYPGGSSDGKVAEGTTKPLSDDDKRHLLHFAIVGGGPTGIEFAAELHDLIHEDLARIYPDLLKFVRITVYDIAPKVLPMFDQTLAKYAMDTFARQGIQVKTEHHIQRVRLADGDLGTEHGGLLIKIKEAGDKEIGAGMVVWSTGLMQNPFIETMVAKRFPVKDGVIGHLVKDGRTGGLVTDGYLRARTSTDEGDNKAIYGPVDGVLEDVYVMGDCAVIEDNRTLPKTAQVASQQATYLARRMNKTGDGVTTAMPPFRFRNWGAMAYLGSWKAIHQSSADELRGWMAWVLWRTAYLTKSMSLRNKITVAFYWAMSWIFGRDISRF